MAVRSSDGRTAPGAPPILQVEHALHAKAL